MKITNYIKSLNDNPKNNDNTNIINNNATNRDLPISQKLNKNSITPDSIENLNLSQKDSLLLDTTINF